MNVYCTALEPFIVHGRTHRAESKNGSEQWNALISTLPPALLFATVRIPRKEMDSEACFGKDILFQLWHNCWKIIVIRSQDFGKVSAHRVHNSTLGCPLSRSCQAFFNPTLFPWKKRSRLSLESFSMNFRQQIFHAFLNRDQTMYLYESFKGPIFCIPRLDFSRVTALNSGVSTHPGQGWLWPKTHERLKVYQGITGQLWVRCGSTKTAGATWGSSFRFRDLDHCPTLFPVARRTEVFACYLHVTRNECWNMLIGITVSCITMKRPAQASTAGALCGCVEIGVNLGQEKRILSMCTKFSSPSTKIDMYNKDVAAFVEFFWHTSRMSWRT